MYLGEWPLLIGVLLMLGSLGVQIVVLWIAVVKLVQSLTTLAQTLNNWLEADFEPTEAVSDTEDRTRRST